MEIRVKIPDHKPALEKGFTRRLERIEKVIRTANKPAKQSSPRINLSAIEKKITSIKQALRTRPKAKNVALNSRLSSIEKKLHSKDALNGSVVKLLTRLMGSIKKQPVKKQVVRKTIIQQQKSSPGLTKALNRNSNALKDVTQRMGKQMIPSPS